MKIELLQNPLDKGESWEKKSKREIEITKSGDNRGCKPNVYFSICAHERIGRKGLGQMQITDDLFIPTELAIQIGKQIISEAKAIDKEWQKHKLRRKTTSKKVKK